ncbi:MAG: radical SAM protein [Methanomicrobiales archaeon]|nr:radical SAM protein [Methanomicrobiales archaeon]
MLLKTTRTLCPVCGKVIPAEIVEENGKVFLERTCPEDGHFHDIYWSDAALYRRFDEFESIGSGLENPHREAPPDGCPSFCGVCTNHRSGTLLANIDLTNRCNLNCDFCFVNAQACGYVYEPSFEQVVEMLTLLRNEKPVPTPAVQFSGGEPTLREDLPDIIRKAKELGFKQVQIATNGVKIARSREYAESLKNAGLNTVYLHFDGITEDTDPQIVRHRKAVEVLDSVHMGVVLVPTIIRGRNDHQVGDILKFAVDHISVIRGVNFQPVAFTGAASDDDVRNARITIPELLERIEAQTEGAIRKDDFYPVPCVVPVSDLVEAYTGKPQIRFTAHQHCGAATYVFVSEKGMVPINRMVDVDKFFAAVKKMAENLRKGGQINKYRTLLEGVNSLRTSVKKGEEVEGSPKIWKVLAGALLFQNYDALREFHWNSLFIGTMHFMDRHNYDISRVQRCCIHYATPDGRVIPFCTYNSGPVYRDQVWRKHSRPLRNGD